MLLCESFVLAFNWLQMANTFSRLNAIFVEKKLLYHLYIKF